jgi:hypothetical protein
VGSDDFIYDGLPDDPEQAFLYLEEFFRNECTAQVRSAEQQEERADIYYVQYISKVLGAITELGLESRFSGQDIPRIDDVNYATYLNFSKDVEHYRTILNIRHARRRKEYTVALDASTKDQLRNLLSKMKQTIDKLDVPQAKKEALFTRITALEEEINRTRTRFEVIAAFWIEGCEAFGDGVEKLEPLRRWVDSIGTLLGKAKKEERSDTRHLPPPKAPKQIEPPKIETDDIPF